MNKKALINVRNTQVGHIQTDYRIACAMLNFLHKPNCPDGPENALRIARKMKEKAVQIKDNKLDFLLKKQFIPNSYDIIYLRDIDDFPTFVPNQAKNEIFFSSYRERQSKSYMVDLIDNARCYKLKNHLIDRLLKDPSLKENQKKSLNDLKNELDETNVIAVEISRHKRSQKGPKNKTVQNNNADTEKLSLKYKIAYKVFVQYVPNRGSSDAIKGKLFFIYC